MTNYLLINVMLTSGALLINSLMQIPHRIRFYLLMAALIGWLIPFGLMSIELSSQAIPIISTERFLTTSQQLISNTVIPISFNWQLLISLLVVAGLIRFGIDLFVTSMRIKYLSNKSRPCTKNPQIRYVKNINGAFVSGYFKPIIWIDEQHRDTQEIHSIITHEQQHISSHDQFWLLLITLIQRLYWFNPLIYILSHKTRHSIELSCDEASKQIIGQSKYQSHLAKLIISKQQTTNALLSNHIHPDESFNVHRVKQLNQENTMKTSQTIKLSLIIFITLLMSVYSLITVAHNSKMPKLGENQILLELKIQKNQQQTKDIKLITSAGEAAQVIYQNHDFKFTPQWVNDEPNQIYTEVLINKIEAGNHTEVARPAIISSVGKMAGIKFENNGTNFNINVTAHTHMKLKQPPVASPAPVPSSPSTATTAAPLPASPITAAIAPVPPAVQIHKNPPQPSTAPVPASPPQPEQAPVK